MFISHRSPSLFSTIKSSKGYISFALVVSKVVGNEGAGRHEYILDLNKVMKDYRVHFYAGDRGELEAWGLEESHYLGSNEMWQMIEKNPSSYLELIPDELNFHFIEVVVEATSIEVIDYQ